MSQQRVLVTGGSGEIGTAIVDRLHEAGYLVDFTYHSAEAAAEQLSERLGGTQSDGGPRSFRCDLSDLAAVERLCDEIADREYYGLVHAAGVASDAIVAAIAVEPALRAMAVNFWAYVLLSKQLIRGMARRRSGRILAVSSVAASRGNRGNAVYASSKAAIEAFNRVFVQEYGGRGVTINAVAPGFVATKMIAHLPGLDERVRTTVPAGRCAEPAEIAQAVCFLASPDASYINGQVITVDGGLSATMGAR